MTKTINRVIIAQLLRTLYFAGGLSTIFMVEKGLSLQEILSLTSIVIISSLLWEIPTGVFADKYGRKSSIVIGAFLNAVGWFIWLFVDSFIGFVCIYAFFGLSNSFWSGSDQAMIYDELKYVGKEKDAQKVFSRYHGALAITFAFAVLIGGIIASTHTLENFYILYFMTFVASVGSFFVALTIHETKQSVIGDAIEDKPQTMLQQCFEGVRTLKVNKKLLTITLFSTFTASFAFMDLYQIYFKYAHVPESWFGYILAISTIGVAAMKWYAYKIEEWFGVEKGMLIIALVPAIIWIAMSFVWTPIFAIVLFFLSDIIGNARDPIIADYQNRHIKGKYRATILSTINVISSAYIALMLPIIGWIADQSLQYAFLTSAAIMLMGVFFFRIKVSDVVVSAK